MDPETNEMDACGCYTRIADEAQFTVDSATVLVICGILPHFFDAATQQFIMFGYVRVLN